MAPVLSACLTGLLLASPSLAQNYGSGREDRGFQYVQPENTTILGPYGHSPPVYPSPNATGAGEWEEGMRKAKAFLAELTLQEKTDMVTGKPGPCTGNILPIPRLGFNGLCLHDGPLAIRMADYASVFMAGVTAASTWDRDILYERGLAMGREFRAKGAHILLGPVAGPLGRSAYSGRNWEGFSADPYLTGVAMEETIKGHQDGGVQACAKHFIVNEQETMRNPVFNDDGVIATHAVSSNIDDRTMHELYLWPFYNAIKANAASIMCSYERINGSYGCANSASLNGLLKTELGFQGYVMSDWGATHTGVAGIEAGQDMDMPGGIGQYGMDASASFFGKNISTAVTNGTLAESRVDDMVLRIMAPYFALGQDVESYPQVDPSTADINTFSPRSSWLNEWPNIGGEANRDVRANHGELIRKQGADAIIMLKNENKSLPLSKPKSIAVFGNDAMDPTNGYVNLADFEWGHLGAGGGSGTGRFTYLVTPLEALKQRASQDKTLIQPFLNNTLVANTSDIRTIWIPEQPDVCLVFLKTWAEEAADRYSLDSDWHGNQVVENVAAQCGNTVVVTHSSGINAMPWADHENVTAILVAHYTGQESGNSLMDVLYGDVNPSGHLPYTIALEADDYNAPPTTQITTDGIYDWQSWFDEKLEVDYRHFDMQGKDVRYEFGFGLSYTDFELENIQASPASSSSSSSSGSVISARPSSDSQVAPGGNVELWETLYEVTASIRNTGSVVGKAVPQLYAEIPGPEGTPPRQLRGFEKVEVFPGESRKVKFALARRDLSYWDTDSQEWVIPEGEIKLGLGFSSRDIKLNATVSPLGVEGEL